MARIARDSTPRRRSARISSNASQSARKAQLSRLQLNSVLERDETPESIEQISIDNVVSTPNTGRQLQLQLEELSKISTPKTEPKPGKEQMHPATVHPTTAKAPDSGMKLGFADINRGRASVASLQNTPTRRRQSIARTNISPTFQFDFRRDAGMSEEGQKMMESIRADAARIKAQMIAEKELQEQRENDANDLLEDNTGRKIAKPTAKAGRFSDVHMAEFKKMDSIANHPSSFRARPGYTRPTAQSLKRSSSKADLDEPERPKTAGKSPSRIPPPVTGRLASTSPFKTIASNTVHQEADIPVKRMRREDDTDVSASRPTTIPRPAPSSLLSPTKASSARAALPAASPPKTSGLSRSNSVKSIRSVQHHPAPHLSSPQKTVQARMNVDKPLPQVPSEEDLSAVAPHIQVPSSPVKSATRPPREISDYASKLPTLSGLKSILRSPHKKPASPRPDTPKRLNTVVIAPTSTKKVDFTPSVKSRYAVKLAECSPSPAKIDHSRVATTFEPAIPYDSSAFVVQHNEEDWEDEMRDIVYPTLPVATTEHTVHTFSQKAKEHSRRESKEFKSIFTTLHPRPEPGISLTTVNTNLNRTNPQEHVSKIALSPPKQVVVPRSPTIRKVRTSEPVQPFEDRIQTVPHGLPGKKRRIESSIDNDRYGGDEDAKENRRISHHPGIPGAWNDASDDLDEGDKRGNKRAKVNQDEERESRILSPVKKPSATREAAVKSAKDRKSKASLGGRGVLSLSRLNMLARPKQRGG